MSMMNALARRAWLLVVVAALIAVGPEATRAEPSRCPNPRYVPIETPLAQTAVLAVWDDESQLGVRIDSIDGQKYQTYRRYVNSGWLVRLLPGKHRLELTYMEINGLSMRTATPALDVELEAGKVYVARARVVDDVVHVHIEQFMPGTSYAFPGSTLRRNDVEMDRLFEEGLDPQEAERRKKAGLIARPVTDGASKSD